MARRLPLIPQTAPCLKLALSVALSLESRDANLHAFRR